MALVFRKATREDAEALSRIARTSKAYWGYPEEWLELWKDYLHVHPDQIETNFSLLAETEEEVCGFIMISRRGNQGEIEHVWVLPEYMGRGLGRKLYRQGLDWAREQGVECLKIAADPHAIGFYEAMGAKWVGETSSVPSPRTIPLMLAWT